MRKSELDKMYQLEDTYWWFIGRRRLVKALVQRFGPPDPQIVDVGCGTGGTLDALHDSGVLTGADVSADALQLCRDRGHQRLTQCVAEALPFHDGAFDVAICCDVFEHLKDDSEGFAEVVRVLKPGGIMVISVPALQWLWSEHDVALSHFRRYEKHQIRDLMKVHGLEISKLTYGVGLLFPAVVASRLMGRLVPHRPRAPHTQVSRLPCMLNQPLLWIQDLETFLIPRWGLPIGASLIAVGRKPLQAASVAQPDAQ